MKKILITLSFCLFAGLAMQAQNADAAVNTNTEAQKARTANILKQKRKEYEERKKANNKAVQKTKPVSKINVNGNVPKRNAKPKQNVITKEMLEKQTSEKKKKQDQ